MPKFNYTVKDEEAHLLTGVFEAKDAASVANELKKRKFTIISIVEEKRSVSLARGRKKIKSIDLVIFARQLSTLIDAGVIEIASKEMSKKLFELARRLSILIKKHRPDLLALETQERVVEIERNRQAGS